MQKKLIALVSLILWGAFLLLPGLWALTSNKEITVDDNSGDSPQIIMRDQDEKTLTLQKLDTGEGIISNSEGAINIQPSTDTVHYLSLSTASNLTGIYWKGHYTNDPAIRINSSGKLEYRDENESTWTTFDSLASGTGSGAPTTATYITQTANSSLNGEQALGSLPSGILKNATTTGILSIATAGTDYYNPGGIDVAVADGGTGTSNGSITGTTALTFTAGGSNQNVNLVPSGTGKVNIANVYTMPTADGTTGQVIKTNGTGTLSWTATGPVDSKYITQTADSTLTNEQALSILPTGLLKNTTVTGVLSTATPGTDYYNPGGTDVAVADGGTGTSNGSITGTTTLTFTAGANNKDIILMPSGTGKVGIGTTNPNYLLDVQGGSIRNSDLAAGGAVYADTNGTLIIGPSDVRLKKGIIPITDRLNVIESLNKLRGVYFHWDTSIDRSKNMGNQQEIGMIAQEVEKVLPEVVRVDNQGYRTLDYAKITAYIIEVCKAQQAQIEELKKQIAEMSKK